MLLSYLMPHADGEGMRFISWSEFVHYMLMAGEVQEVRLLACGVMEKKSDVMLVGSDFRVRIKMMRWSFSHLSGCG